MVENTVDIQSGQVVYCSKAGQTLEKQGYQVTIPVSDRVKSLKVLAPDTL